MDITTYHFIGQLYTFMEQSFYFIEHLINLYIESNLIYSTAQAQLIYKLVNILYLYNLLYGLLTKHCIHSYLLL